MRRYTTPKLSRAASEVVDQTLHLLCCLCDTVIYLLVGFCLVVEVPWAGCEPTGEQGPFQDCASSAAGTPEEVASGEEYYAPASHLDHGLSVSMSMFACVMLLCLAARLIHVFSIIGVCNMFTQTK